MKEKVIKPIWKNKENVRIEYLESLARWYLYSFEILVSLEEQYHDENSERNPLKILNKSSDHIKKIINFESFAYYLVNENSQEFVLTHVFPESKKEVIEKLVNQHIADGKFAWAINQNAPILSKSINGKKDFVFHVLATKRRVRGMFVGIINSQKNNIEERIKYPLSIILQNTANAIESLELYQLLEWENKNLEKKINSRTKELEISLKKVEEEVAYRKIAEESLWFAKESAESATRLKNEFLANMSHELRTPLNSILGYSEMLQAEAQKLNRNDLIQDLKTIDSAGKHLLSLINDVLDMAKFQSGRLKLEIETFSISNLINEIVSTLNPIAQKNGNTLRFNGKDELGRISSDITRVRQIFLNVVGNACKFTQDGEIIINAHWEEEDNNSKLIIAISDTGIGMSPKLTKRVFDEFYQGRKTKDKKDGGTGLGLSISRQLVVLLGGNINVDSELGKGSVFTISLPKDYNKAENYKEKQIQPNNEVSRVEPNYEKMGSQEQINFDGKNEKVLETSKVKTFKPVLFVKDNIESYSEIKPFLFKKGYYPIFALNPEEALLKTMNIKPFFIVFDMRKTGSYTSDNLNEFVNHPNLIDVPVYILADSKFIKTNSYPSHVIFLKGNLNIKRMQEIIKNLKKVQLKSPILLVEKDPINQAMLDRVFKNEGWNVVLKSNGKKALDYIQKKKPSLIMTDMSMDEMSGVEFITKLRKNKSLDKTPLIVFTAKEITGEEYNSIKNSVQRFIYKGNCTRDELVNGVMEVVAR